MEIPKEKLSFEEEVWLNPITVVKKPFIWIKILIGKNLRSKLKIEEKYFVSSSKIISVSVF